MYYHRKNRKKRIGQYRDDNRNTQRKIVNTFKNTDLKKINIKLYVCVSVCDMASFVFYLNTNE